MYLKMKVPADKDGFVNLKCPLCGEKFKLSVSVLEAEETLYIWCPGCGLISRSYYDDDVYSLAEAKAINIAEDKINNILKEFEGNTKNSIIQFQMSKPEKMRENRLKTILDYSVLKACADCRGLFKIMSTLSISTYYCPICGGIQDGE